ncbi:hypothetical protein JXA05_04330 [Candidatus Peregrinibacteria bacterium]|nr:hypothetical protein [Candidatus Peregrinibacteria bacterium]
MLSKKGGIKVWILFLLIIALLLGLLFYLRSKTIGPSPEGAAEPAKPSKGFVEIELTPEQKKEVDNAALSQALLSGSAEDCEKITWDEALKKQCLDAANFADILRGGDEKQCEKLHDPKMKQDCYDKIYQASAKDTLDIALCEKIANEALKQNCKDTLLALMGRKASSVQDCDAIQDPALRKNCRDSYFFEASVDSLDEANCDRIGDAATKDRCVATIVQNKKVIAEAQSQAVREYKSGTEILSGCDKFSGEAAIACKDEANFDLALEKKDLTYCNTIVDAVLKNKCVNEQGANINRFYLRQAVAKKNPTLCGKITNEETRSLCLQSVQ